MSITVRWWRLLLITVSLRRVRRTWTIAGGVRSRIGSRGAVAGMSLIRGVAAVVEVLVRRRRRGREVSRGRITVSTFHGIQVTGADLVPQRASDLAVATKRTVVMAIAQAP
jgi:hypothetical protein